MPKNPPKYGEAGYNYTPDSSDSSSDPFVDPKPYPVHKSADEIVAEAEAARQARAVAEGHDHPPVPGSHEKPESHTVAPEDPGHPASAESKMKAREEALNKWRSDSKSTRDESKDAPFVDTRDASHVDTRDESKDVI